MRGGGMDDVTHLVADNITQVALGFFWDGSPGRLRGCVQVRSRVDGLEDAQVIPAGLMGHV